MSTESTPNETEKLPQGTQIAVHIVSKVFGDPMNRNAILNANYGENIEIAKHTYHNMMAFAYGLFPGLVDTMTEVEGFLEDASPEETEAYIEYAVSKESYLRMCEEIGIDPDDLLEYGFEEIDGLTDDPQIQSRLHIAHIYGHKMKMYREAIFGDIELDEEYEDTGDYVGNDNTEEE